MAEILALATAGLKPNQLSDTDHIHYPRVDYLELQRFINIDVLDYTAYDRTRLGGFFRHLETKLRSDLYLTMLGLLRKHRYRLIFTMSERVGIPFAALNRIFPDRKSLVSRWACWSFRQERMITGLNLLSAMDGIIVTCQSLKRHFVKLGAPVERIHVIPFGVDHHFFAPVPDIKQQNGFILSLGELRNRDYATLFQAVDGLRLKLLVTASGSWYAREKNTDLNIAVPENVTIAGRRLSRAELKQLYAQSQFVVLPLHDVLFPAGSTAILETMCMGRAVIVTRSQGILDYVVDGETGIVVDVNDAAAMREAIQDLLAHPEKAHRLGQNARQRIDEELNLDVYVERIASLLHACL